MISELSNKFLNYTDYYKGKNNNFDLKIEHTFRVISLCEKIARSINLEEKDVEIAKICGLFHDVGRFEQFNRYHTFNDKKSIDHGDLGFELLKNELLEKFNVDKSLYNIILSSVKYHNKYQVPNLSEKELLMVSIVRDADKIDIMSSRIEDRINNNIKLENEIISEEVFDDVLNNKYMSFDKKKTKADTIGMWMGMLYDLNFDISYQILDEKDYIDTLLNYYLEEDINPTTKDQLQVLKKHMNKYIKARVK